MSIVLYIFAGLFIIFALFQLISFLGSRHFGLLIAAAVFGISGFLAMNMLSFWPLIIGFGLGWVLRMIGLDPGYQ